MTDDTDRPTPPQDAPDTPATTGAEAPATTDAAVPATPDPRTPATGASPDDPALEETAPRPDTGSQAEAHPPAAGHPPAEALYAAARPGSAPPAQAPPPDHQPPDETQPDPGSEDHAQSTDVAPADTPAGDSTPGDPSPPAAQPRPAPPPPREPDEESLRVAEALVFSSAEPTTPRSLARILPDDMDADSVIAALRARYAGRGVELIDAGPGVMFRTAADLAPKLRKVIESPRRLPRVAMETLAIIAYHQPMTRPEIEHIRGSALSQQTLDSLLELSLIAPKGRRESPGRPTLWGTTPEFLAHFGLKDLRELPRREDLLLEPTPPRPETVTPDLQSPANAEPGETPAPP